MPCPPDGAFFVGKIAFCHRACYTEFKESCEVSDVKCPVCCESFTGTRCPRCGMRVSGSEDRLFSGEQPRPASRQAVRTVQKQPVRRTGKISSQEWARRQQAAADRTDNRVFIGVIVFLMVVVIAKAIPLIMAEVSAAPQPEPVAPASEIVYDSPYTGLELELEDWAASEGLDTLFFYMEDEEVMNGSLYLPEAMSLAEQAAAGDGAALERWNEMAAQCLTFYQDARQQMDDLGRSQMPLNVWLADSDSGDLLLSVDQDGIWYNYYEDLLAEQS